MADYASNLVQDSAVVNSVNDQTVEPSFAYFLTALTTVADPVTFKKVVQYSYWVDAMNCELEALKRNGMQ